MDAADGSVVLKVLEQVQLLGEKFAQLQDGPATPGRRRLDWHRSPALPPMRQPSLTPYRALGG